MRFVDASVSGLDDVLAGADVVVLGSEGIRPTPGVLVQALATGIVPVASGLPVYEELLGEGSRGLVYPPGDAETLASQLSRLLTEPGLLDAMRVEAEPFAQQLSFERVTDEFEQIYGELVGRRHDLRPRNETARRAVAERPLIDVDLHMHTDHSYDCATPVEVLLAEARAKGLGAIAVTEHNEISGALAAADLAGKAGVKVIVGEEVKTAEQGEVIGLFIKEKIPRGLTLQEQRILRSASGSPTATIPGPCARARNRRANSRARSASTKASMSALASATIAAAKNPGRISPKAVASAGQTATHATIRRKPPAVTPV